MNVIGLVEKQARMRPQAPAIIDVRRGRERSLTFGELCSEVTRIAALLESNGIPRGAGVLIFQPMSPELYLFLLALFYLGAVGLFVDPSAGRDHIERCCRMCPPKAFFGTSRSHLLRLISPEVRGVPLHFGTCWLPGSVNVLSCRVSPRSNLAPVDGDGPALITFTSGSTGIPKAAVRTHHFLQAQHRALAASLCLTPETLDLATLPIFVLANLASGVTSVLPNTDMGEPGSCDPVPIIEQIERHQVDSTAASPAFIERLADECIRTSRPLASLKKVLLGGAPVFPRVLDHARKAFPNAAITAVYGSTEAEPMAELAFDSISEEDVASMRNGRGLLVGAPVSSIQLQVIRDQWGNPIGHVTASEFAEMNVPIGHPGEIVVSGEHVLSGYLHGENESETKFDVDAVRWHRTGDLGYFDSCGRLWLLGRGSAKIQDRRGTLYSLTVECALQHDPRVARAALVEVRGERVLVLQPRNGYKLDTESYQRQLSWASLDRLVTLAHIPVDKRHNAKIDYRNLKLLLQRSS
jgi:acyl-CoA synthetase (AMP-forming)/AMP-acid ligase II